MALLPVTVDYTDLDFDAVRARLINVVRSVFPTWEDFETKTFDNVLLELFAYVADVVLFYLDNRAAESRISTAQLRSSLLALAKLVGYIPAGAVAARVDCVFTQTGATTEVTVPADQLVSTDAVTTPVEFRTLGELVIPAPAVPGGSSSATITAENSRAREDQFVSTDVADQRYALSRTPFLDGSLLVADGIGDFEVVDNLLSSTSTDRHVTVDVDEFDRATVTFGDGRNGVIPVGTIVFSYRTGGGAAGTVEAGTVTTVRGSFTDSLGNPVILTTTNPEASTQGVDRASRDEIRVEAPESTRAPRRTVSREDFEIHAREVPGVGRALMLTSDELPSIAENTGQLYILPVGGGVATAALISAVVEAITVTKPHTLTFTPEVVTAPLLTVDVSVSVFFDPPDSQIPVIRASIAEALVTYFDPTRDPEAEAQGERRVDFGFRYRENNTDVDGRLPWSDVFNAVRDVPGVAKIDDGPDNLLLNGQRLDVVVGLNQFPVLGEIVVKNARTNTPV